MKKFFSLVLALVMALSLTTVAWGATAVEITVKNSDELIAAINGDKTKIGLEDGDYALQFTNNTAFNVDGLTIVGLGDAVKLDISSTEVHYGRIQGDKVVFENIIFTDSTVGATGEATYKNCTIAGRLECASSGAAKTYAYDCAIGEVHTSTDMNAGAAYFENCEIAVAAYNAKDTMTFTGGSIGELNIWGGDTVLNDCEIDPEDISYVGSGNDTIVMDDSLVASDAATLITAMNAATSGATIKLLDDITITQDWDCRTPAKGGVGATFTVPVTIDGNGKTLKFTGKVFDGYNHLCAFRFEADATVKNLTIDMSEAVSGWGQRLRAISAKENLTVDNCEFYGNPNYNNTRAIIFAEGQQVHSDVEISVTNSVFKDWTYGLTDNENGKDVKSVSASENTFTDAGVQLSASEEVVFNDNTVDGGKVTITSYAATNELSVTATGNTLDADEVNKIKAETITTDTNDFAATGALVAPAGYEVVERTDGTEVVVPTTLLGEKFDLYLANAQLNANLKAGTATVSGIILTEVPANTFSNGSGNVAYVKGNNGEYYVKTTTPYTTSYAVTAADKTTVLYYVNAAGTEAGAFTYTAKATEFKNFSLAPKCDYVTGKPVVGATYFQLADGTVYMAADASATEANNYLVGDTVYSKGAPQTVVKHTFKANNYKYDAASGKNIPTSAICTTCLTTSSAIYLDEKVPAGVFAYDLAAPDAAYAVVVATPSAPVVGSTDKVVQSADTFDAGIAMYVGMSVMAAAGSAVVLKKKD